MTNYSPAATAILEASVAVIANAAIDAQRHETAPTVIEISKGTADEWFADGHRVPYDRRSGTVLPRGEGRDSPDVIEVFRRITHDAPRDDNPVWTSFLPGWPDGSFGWAKVDRHLSGADIGPRLFVEYVGHGESDKPSAYPYGTDERADLIEAMWRAEGIRSTFLVAFDYSSIVALELLSRQQERREGGVDQATKIVGVLLINGGLFAEAHTHPWFTTPVLKSPIGGLVTALAQRSKFVFRHLMMPVWSKDFVVTDQEFDQLHDAIGRRNGVSILGKTADFVDHHRRKAARLNLERLFHTNRHAVSFHIVGSAEDPFEGRQAVTAKARLGQHGLDVRLLPGGHLTTSEHPALLADIIQEVALGAEHVMAA